MFRKDLERIRTPPESLNRLWKEIKSEWRAKVQKQPSEVKDFFKTTEEWLGIMKPSIWKSWKSILVGLGFGVGMGRFIWNNPAMKERVLKSASDNLTTKTDAKHIKSCQFRLPSEQPDPNAHLRETIRTLEAQLQSSIPVTECEKKIEEQKKQIKAGMEHIYEDWEPTTEDIIKKCEGFIHKQIKQSNLLTSEQVKENYTRNADIAKSIEQDIRHGIEQGLKERVEEAMEDFEKKFIEEGKKLQRESMEREIQECQEERDEWKRNYNAIKDKIPRDNQTVIKQNELQELKNLEKEFDALLDKKVKQHTAQLRASKQKIIKENLYLKQENVFLQQEVKEKEHQIKVKVSVMLISLQKVIEYITEMISQADTSIQGKVETALSDYIEEAMSVAKQTKVLDWKNTTGGGGSVSLAHILRQARIPKVNPSPVKKVFSGPSVSKSHKKKEQDWAQFLNE